MPSLKENLYLWDKRHHWQEDGDEWNDQAAFCHQPYSQWKRSLVETFINPNVSPTAFVVEVGPGHGRWSGYMIQRAGHVTLVDFSSNCIEYCKRKFAQYGNKVSYYVNDGMRLRGVPDESVDFIWSYDSFVHMERDVIESYLKEFRRVLKHHGKAIIHHANRRHWALPFGNVLRILGKRGKRLYTNVSMGRNSEDDGLRCHVSAKMFVDMALRTNLRVTAQTDSWGPDDRFNCRLYRDCITVLVKR